MSDPMRIRAVRNKDMVEIKLMIKHPMESGLRRDMSGKRVPANFIETLVVRCKDKVVLDAYLGMAVSENPFITFNFEGGQVGDVIEVTWTDNLHESRTDTAQIA
ncbi:MAG: thiosulfate oxidation carrier complex protein SoxZ [Burkholderiaceae bacterium]|jgi:sulfur-oxidizing protein SoxZ